MDVHIQQMTLDHLSIISDILHSDFDDFWSTELFSFELESSSSHYIVATLNNEIVGFAGVKFSEDICDIMNIVVKKSFRGNGISSLLLANLIKNSNHTFTSMMLEVNTSNSIAISLYEKFDFEIIHTRKNYYKDQSAYIMKKTIKKD